MSHTVELPESIVPAHLRIVPTPSAAAPWTAPPPPVLTVRVGVTGHRELPHADMNGLRCAIDRVLGQVGECVSEVASRRSNGYAAATPCLAAVSPLADGADRIFASAACTRGWELHVPMPFPEAEYERDFTAASRDEFRALRSRAKRVLELDGLRTRSELAYLRVGQVTLHQCEVLVAVWDGNPPSGVGGTAQIVDEGYARGIPVVWISSAAPHDVGLLATPPQEDPRKVPLMPALAQRLQTMLLPPAPEIGQGVFVPIRKALGGPAVRLHAENYYRPLRFREWPVPFYGWFHSALLLGAGVKRPASSSPPPPWRDFHWADSRANYHAQAYRSAFTITYLLGSLAVLCALTYGYKHAMDPEVDAQGFVWAELVITLLAVLTVVLAWLGRWHILWLDERLLAERFRQLDLLQRLGRSAPGTRAQSDPLQARPDELWGNWLFRAHSRAIGMPSRQLDGPYLEEYHRHLEEVLDGQREYHHYTHAALHTVRERLHLFSLALFASTLGICIVHLLEPEMEEAWHGMLILLAGALPAFAAAIAGIIGHGEFQRIARISRSIGEGMDRAAADLANLRPGASREEMDRAASDPGVPRRGTSREYGRIAENVCELMLSDLLAWHLLASERPVEVG